MNGTRGQDVCAKLLKWGSFFVVKIAHHIRRAAHGYEQRREAAMAAKS
jgi:hypothetical protein